MRRLIAIAVAALLAVLAVPVAASASEPPPLEFRDTGKAVVVLQRALGVQPTGFFGRQTERAVKALQIRHGVKPVGKVGPITWALLGPRVSRAAARFAADAADQETLPWNTYAGRDMVGYRPSTYRGTYFDPRFEQYRLCVVQRESGGHYGESSGGFLGAYQFSYSLSAQALRAMRAEMGAVFGSAGLAFLDRLSGKPMYAWPRYAQDAAFWTIFNGGAGWSHWSSQWGGSWNCDHRAKAESGWPSPNHWNYSPLEG